MEMKSCRLGDIAFITKLAGFEHTKYIQGNCVREKVDDTFIPLFIGKTIRDGKIDTNFDWYISKKIADKLPRSFLKRKCLVLPYVGSLGDLAIFDASYEALLGSNVAKIELNQDCEFTEEFIYYFLKSPYGQSVLLKDEQGGIQKNITMESIRNVILPDISVSNQKKITDVLSALDDKIALNQRINRNLEELARLIYDYWFVQFDFPDKNGKPYKTSGGKMVYNDQLKREIPEGWEVKTLKECIKRINTGLNPRDNFVLGNGDIKYVTVKNLTMEGNIDFSGCDFIDEDALKKVHKRSDIAKGDVLYASICPLGRSYLINKDPVGWDINESVFSIRPNLDVISSEFLSVFLKDSAVVEKASKMATGSIFKGIRIKELENMILAVPVKDVMEKFSKQKKNLIELEHKNTEQIAHLTTLRDKLLPLLMNGQVVVG